MNYKPGSFNWFLHDKIHPWYNQLAKIFSIADRENRDIIKKSFYLVSTAYENPDWDECTQRKWYELVPDEYSGLVSYKKAEKLVKTSATGNQGSFNWYMRSSGSFVMNMAILILMSNDKGLDIINKMYPQMIAAFKSDDWKNPPKGFNDNVYNATLVL